MSRRQPFTQRAVTSAVRGITGAGLALKSVRIDPATGCITVDIVDGAGVTADDSIDAVLDRRIAEQEKSARPRKAKTGAGARRNCTLEEPS